MQIFFLTCMARKYKCKKIPKFLRYNFSHYSLTYPTSNYWQQLLVLLLPSAALHLFLLWKYKKKKTNNGKGLTAFSLQSHFSFLKTFQNIFCRHARGVMWIRVCRSSMPEKAKTLSYVSLCHMKNRRTVHSACCCRRGRPEDLRRYSRSTHTEFSWLPNHTNRHKFLPVDYQVVNAKLFSIITDKQLREQYFHIVLIQ